MAFYSCNRYKIIVSLLIILIVIQLVRLLSPRRSSDLSQSDIIKLEDSKFNKHLMEKVEIKVYYEGLCIDSRYFFTKQLRPVTDKLAAFMNVTLIPYGKATTTIKDGKYEFSCQHGPRECYANKIHACSISRIADMKQRVQFTECMILDYSDPDAALLKCSKLMEIPSEPIKICAGNNQGSELLKNYGDETNIIEPTFIPTVTINGKLADPGEVTKNFLLKVCQAIDIPLPPPCL